MQIGLHSTEEDVKRSSIFQSSAGALEYAVAGSATTTAFENISMPTLIVSCEDDLFGTAETA